jgi:hypothetical protein
VGGGGAGFCADDEDEAGDVIDEGMEELSRVLQAVLKCGCVSLSASIHSLSRVLTEP